MVKSTLGCRDGGRVLPEALSSVFSTHIKQLTTSASRDLMPLSSADAHAYVYPPIYIIKNKFLVYISGAREAEPMGISGSHFCPFNKHMMRC